MSIELIPFMDPSINPNFVNPNRVPIPTLPPPPLISIYAVPPPLVPVKSLYIASHYVYIMLSTCENLQQLRRAGILVKSFLDDNISCMQLLNRYSRIVDRSILKKDRDIFIHAVNEIKLHDGFHRLNRYIKHQYDKRHPN